MGNDKVIALPHLGASTEEAEINCAVMVADTLRGYLENGLVRHSVNFPDADLPRMDAHRITIANANVPNMVGQISGCLGDAGLNIPIIEQESRQSGVHGCGSDGAPSEQVIGRIRAIEGVLCVRDLGRPGAA
jgi:D-3-phosphoglycerate dehydrogenase